MSYLVQTPQGIYPSLREASLHTGFSTHTVSKLCKMSASGWSMLQNEGSRCDVENYSDKFAKLQDQTFKSNRITPPTKASRPATPDWVDLVGVIGQLRSEIALLRDEVQTLRDVWK